MYPSDSPGKMADNPKPVVQDSMDSSEKESTDLLMQAKQTGSVFQSIVKLKTAADMARQAYDNEAAVKYYKQSLELACQHPGTIDAQTEYDLLSGRAACLELLGLYREQQLDLDVMRRLAKEIEDVPRQIQVVTSQVILDNSLGIYVEAQQAAESALELARQVGNRALEADCLTSLGVTFNSLSDYAHTLACHEEALRIRRELGDT